MTLQTALSEAQSFVDRAAEQNADLEVSRLSLVKAVNSAITLVLTIAAFGIFFAVWDQQLADQAKINQEITWKR